MEVEQFISDRTHKLIDLFWVKI